MGYCSDVVIGVKKEVLARHLLEQEIPECLGEPTRITDTAAYWFISSWKWYASYPEIIAIEAWFCELEDEEFGALRMGEDLDDIQAWGSPRDFGIRVNRSITYPE